MKDINEYIKTVDKIFSPEIRETAQYKEYIDGLFKQLQDQKDCFESYDCEIPTEERQDQINIIICIYLRRILDWAIVEKRLTKDKNVIISVAISTKNGREKIAKSMINPHRNK